MSGPANLPVPQKAVVFAYSEVGVRCLAVLLDSEIEVRLVITHADDPGEQLWFESVARLAEKHSITTLMPSDPNDPLIVDRIRAIDPDWVFSFYYRMLLGTDLLSLARRGALNLHGSLLPSFRGRAPVNWAILKGATETGASLHQMVARPDAGALIDQLSVPILINDQAIDVARKVTAAAEIVLWRTLPGLIAGTAASTPLNLRMGSYYGGRRPEDGRIDEFASTSKVHNLIRAVAPPYPGAFIDFSGPAGRKERLVITGSLLLHEPGRSGPGALPAIYLENDSFHMDCADGGRITLTGLEIDGEPLASSGFQSRFGRELILR